MAWRTIGVSGLDNATNRKRWEQIFKQAMSDCHYPQWVTATVDTTPEPKPRAARKPKRKRPRGPALDDRRAIALGREIG
jgi:hypothetical protein